MCIFCQAQSRVRPINECMIQYVFVWSCEDGRRSQRAGGQVCKIFCLRTKTNQRQFSCTSLRDRTPEHWLWKKRHAQCRAGNDHLFDEVAITMGCKWSEPSRGQRSTARCSHTLVMYDRNSVDMMPHTLLICAVHSNCKIATFSRCNQQLLVKSAPDSRSELATQCRRSARSASTTCLLILPAPFGPMKAKALLYLFST